MRHSRNFERHYAHLQERVGRENHKQDVIAHFFTNHDEKFHKILHNQEKSLNCGPLADRVRRMTHRTTNDYLLAEEQLYSELLTLVHTKTEKIDFIARRLLLDERYDAVTKNALTVTLASEALLLGPLEVLSLPLWGAYFGLKEIRDHHKHFEQWRSIRKHRIQ